MTENNKQKSRPQRQLFDVSRMNLKCSSCSRPVTKMPFKPEKGVDIYCDECNKKRKEKKIKESRHSSIWQSSSLVRKRLRVRFLSAAHEDNKIENFFNKEVEMQFIINLIGIGGLIPCLVFGLWFCYLWGRSRGYLSGFKEGHKEGFEGGLREGLNTAKEIGNTGIPYGLLFDLPAAVKLKYLH